MVLITVDLVRKKSEHNEKEIGTLEELSLHQENVEKIEHLQNWCRNLEILLLQSNLISKIENLSKLKKLRYLNLALNNIERIENLEGLESLEKLDLTLNFVGDLKSVASLKNNRQLTCLILTGNPCCDFEFYRDFVVAEVPQIPELDGVEITRSDRISARQGFQWKLRRVEEEQNESLRRRNGEKEEEEGKNTCADEDGEAFWNKPSKNTPEERTRIAKKAQEIREKDSDGGKKKEVKKKVELFDKDGRPVNTNQPKIPFKLYDDEDGNKVLEVQVYRYLDTNHVAVDIHPTYVTVKIKGKPLQLVFDEEVRVDASSCQRSMTTGALLIKMPRCNFTPTRKTTGLPAAPPREDKNRISKCVDFRNIIKKEDWLDDPDVPPLE